MIIYHNVIKGVYSIYFISIYAYRQILDCFTTVISDTHTDALLSTSREPQQTWRRSDTRITASHVIRILREVDIVVRILLI